MFIKYLRRKLFDSDLEYEAAKFEHYKKVQLLEIEFQKKQVALQLVAAEQNAKFECQWHSEREKRNTELALLNASVAAKKELLVSLDTAINEKKELIERLLKVIETSTVNKVEVIK